MSDTKDEPILIDYLIKDQMLKRLQAEREMFRRHANKPSLSRHERNQCNTLSAFADSILEDLEVDDYIDTMQLVDQARATRDQTIH